MVVMSHMLFSLPSNTFYQANLTNVLSSLTLFSLGCTSFLTKSVQKYIFYCLDLDLTFFLLVFVLAEITVFPALNFILLKIQLIKQTENED